MKNIYIQNRALTVNATTNRNGIYLAVATLLPGGEVDPLEQDAQDIMVPTMRFWNMLRHSNVVKSSASNPIVVSRRKVVREELKFRSIQMTREQINDMLNCAYYIWKK